VSAFSAAIEALFADANLGIDAIWRPAGAGPGIPVRAIVRRPDRIGDFGETRIVAETVIIDVRVSQVPVPAEGDTFEIGGETFVIQGEPLRDSERLIWTVEARPA
jgi:hypothetical protein